MKKISVALSLGLCLAVFGAPQRVRAQDLSRVDDNSAAANFTRVTWRLNGFVEFEMRPLARLTPPSFGFPRSAAATVGAFVGKNVDILAIRQSPSDFVLVSTRVDGAVTSLTYAQTYRALNVETSQLTFDVVGTIVTRVEGRFISDVSRLPDCASGFDRDALMRASVREGRLRLPAAVEIGSPSFRAFGVETHSVAILIWDVSNDRNFEVRDVCTTVLLDGWTEHDPD